MPHRIELWESLEQIKAIGYEKWIEEAKKDYTCPQCHVINSAYDLKCRKCGIEPSCSYVAKHKPAIEKFFNDIKM